MENNIPEIPKIPVIETTLEFIKTSGKDALVLISISDLAELHKKIVQFESAIKLRNIKTSEEILKKYPFFSQGQYNDPCYNKKYVLMAMEEYANQFKKQ